MLEARALTKRYPGVVALDQVDFSVDAGEVVALIGENGAGKSTLIKLFGGLIQPDGGEILMNGASVVVANVATAAALGIGVIHQELSNLTNIDVAGNVFLGREPRKLGFLIDRKEMVRRTHEYLKPLGLELDPEALLSGLSIARQQMVEIAKALSLEAKYLIMDEPTSSLTSSETAQLLKVVADLRSHGVGVVYVSHRLDEVKHIADRAIAFRDGKNAGSLKREELTTENMVRLMVGRDLVKQTWRGYVAERPRLVVNGLRTRRFPDHEITFSVGNGEIVGIAGLVGAGRSEVAQAIFGVDTRLSGTVELDGAMIPPESPRASIAAGLYLAPEDRRKEGLITSMAVRENVTLADLGRYSKGFLIQAAKEREVSTRMREKLRIKSPSIESEVRGLSGGNQQKVVLAKWLSLSPKCLIFDEPTRGIDVGARAEIYDLMRALAAEGVAILMISSDMEEVLALSDRVVVMHEGMLSGVLPRDQATEESIMHLAVRSA